ncbi:Ependymin-2 Ependymin II [Channa argus]|uniref:Ependymin-2 Ependymin II n=1 Tax=Channa argus TaxID=215402 RepID=A0A6G1Q5L4_CHAAH|nr:Ependymin-2 Ependymin II [Channa argus]
MRLFVALTCLLAGCVAQEPQPCRTPPLMSGAFTVSTQNKNLGTYNRYLYDAEGQRMRLVVQGFFNNKTFVTDFLVDYNKDALYSIVDSKRECKKMTLKGDFKPMGIPPTASPVGQTLIGSPGAGAGLLINIWTGDLPNKAGKFLSSVTEHGCVPVSTLYFIDNLGTVAVNFFNNAVEISDLSLLNAPDFCQQAEVDPAEEPKDFLSLFSQDN